RIILQLGSTPSTYYAAEPNLPGASGASAANAALWKYVQEAWVSYKAPIGMGLRVQMGLFPSPVGPEVIPVKDNWNWSRSDLFVALPTYQTGLQAIYDLTPRLSAIAGIYNGWNDVVDDNEEKSISAHVTYQVPEALLVQVLYFGGVERPTGSPEGPYWRHLFDAFAQWDATARLSLLAHADAGWEPNRFGVSDWVAGALYARVKVIDGLYVAARGDRFNEDVARNATGSATPIFWPVGWVSSATATLDVRPTGDHLSVRFEYRHDQADGAIYFRGSVAGSGSTTSPFIPNATSQDTLTVGATGWF
ncbi:MAG: outer membrane beta-barrel protein, partial [Polyangiaceae bacterium]